eukprot:GFUD01003060.1.p1 GENE.GFUD01003060.1~~GFUD01003060.1.p1  ORF type:complete len:914 (+),score=90.26 GFUD01003060.1:82-2823(+)
MSWFGTKRNRIVGFRLNEDTLSNPEIVDKCTAESGTKKDPDENKYTKETKKLTTWMALVVLLWLIAVFLLVIVMDRRLPSALTMADHPDNPNSFIEERARRTLQALTSIGARPAGSYENEVLAVALIKRELTSIKERANPIHKVSIDIQKPRGSFNLQFVDGLTHSYRNIQNVVAKLESGNGAKHALLVNCHFDSVPQSPGASDDAVSCAIMLEVLEVLTQSPEPLRHNIIFLFNGAEENMLPASHGFITQHMWAEEIRAFINLEACGSGGRELVFQTGPGHPWLVTAYANVAPHPFASVIGQELFQSGVIPADTDFRIFRDYGKIPGLDIAYMKNGYVYHTKYDTEERIPPGSIQRAGDNLLAVVKHIAQSEILADTLAHAQGGVVFFDFLGLFLIHYSEWMGILLNLVIVGISVSITVTKIRHSYNYGVSKEVYLRQLGYTFMIQLCGCVASFMAVTLISVLMDAFGRPMSWYSQPWLICPLYMAPTVMSVIAIFYFVLPRQKKYFQFVDGVWIIESLYFEVSKLIWALFTLVMTILRLKSSFFCMSWVLFPMAGRLILDRMYDSTPTKRKQKDIKWLLIHLISLLVPLILNMYLIFTTFSMFIPIMSRAGYALNPDLIIGYKAASMTLATISFLCPLAMVMNKPMNVITTLYVTTFVTMGVCLFTNFGFPYSNTPNNLSPHRGLVIHTDRAFYNKDGALEKEDSGYFMVNLDRNSPKILNDWIPELKDAKEIKTKDCEEHLYCGMPVYYPAASLLRVNHWIPAPKPKLWTPISLNITHMEAPTINTRKLLFKAVGPDHMGVFISPAIGITLKSWSLADGKVLEGPEWKMGRPTHYIFHSSGKENDSWEFWLELEVPRSHYDGNELLDMAITGHYLHGSQMKSAQFTQFLSQYPGWSYPVGWTASYKGYKF